MLVKEWGALWQGEGISRHHAAQGFRTVREGLEEMSEPAPHVPPPLAEDTDAALLELTQRCQSGFD